MANTFSYSKDIKQLLIISYGSEVNKLGLNKELFLNSILAFVGKTAIIIKAQLGEELDEFSEEKSNKIFSHFYKKELKNLLNGYMDKFPKEIRNNPELLYDMCITSFEYLKI